MRLLLIVLFLVLTFGFSGFSQPVFLENYRGKRIKCGPLLVLNESFQNLLIVGRAGDSRQMRTGKAESPRPPSIRDNFFIPLLGPPQWKINWLY